MFFGRVANGVFGAGFIGKPPALLLWQLFFWWACGCTLVEGLCYLPALAAPISLAVGMHLELDSQQALGIVNRFEVQAWGMLSPE